MNSPEFIAIVLIIAATALALSIKILLDVQRLKKEVEKNVYDTEDSLRAIRKALDSAQREADVSEQLKAIVARLDKLERPARIAASVAGSGNSPQQAPMPSRPATKQLKDGFFGSPKGDAETALFNDQYDELRDECFFTVHYNSPTEGEFAPIDLMRLKSLPSIEGVVRYEGCPLKEARGFQLISKGIVKKQSNYWVVTSPAELQMIK